MRLHRKVGILAVGAGMLLGTSIGTAKGPQQCIQAAQQAKKACVKRCGDTFQANFVACFGPAGGCAQTCVTAQMSCESGPLAAIQKCASDPTNPNSCRSVLKAALAACKSDPNPQACTDTAELNALRCRQACQDHQQPNIDVCQDAFRMCLKGCTPTTTIPTSTTTTTMP